MCPTLPEDEIEARLRSWPVARLGTLREDGRPHLVPVVFVYRDGVFWIPVDGKPKRDRPLERVHNLLRDPRATLLLDAYREDWSALWWIHIDGVAEIRVAESDDDPRFRVPRDAFLEKYAQYQEWPLFRGVPTLIEIATRGRNTWCSDLAGLPPVGDARG